MNKAELRLHYKEKREALPQLIFDQKNADIARHFFSFEPYLKAQKILFYASLSREVNTRFLIEAAVAQKKQVFLPRMDGEILRCLSFDGFDRGRTNAWGVWEPALDAIEIDPSRLDLIVLPGLAFDLQGNRLGFGKGFYDRLLHSTKSIRVALALSDQVAPSLPIEAHDEKMDFLITDERIYTF